MNRMRRVYNKNKRAIALIFCMMFLISLLAAPLLSSISVRAEGDWDDSVYRVYAPNGEIDDSEVTYLDSLCCQFIETWQIDLVMASINSEENSGSLEDNALKFYESNPFGYGSGKDGVILGVDPATNSAAIVTIGRAGDFFTASAISDMEKTISAIMEGTSDNAVYSAFVGFYQEAETYMSGLSNEGIMPLSEPSTEGDTVSVDPNKNSSLPDWYPANVSSFTKFHDSSRSRVIDNAGIFSEGEKAEMKSLIAEYAEVYGRDIVIVTENDTYGLDHQNYTADFYDYNGYGIGDEYEGMCLMICMNTDHRGWYACATGSDTIKMYNEETSTKLDDALYEYMANGNYGEGVIDWIKNIGVCYKYGYFKHVKTFGDWIKNILVSLGLGGIVGGIGTGSAKAKMKTVRKATEASHYIKGQPIVTPVSDVFINFEVSRVKIESDSNRSSGGSSHSSFSGSSGTSHSGSGRSF